MTAFNSRLRPKEVFGFPLTAVLAGVVSMVGLFLAIVPDILLLNILSGIIALAAFLVAVVMVAAGDEVMFLRLRLMSNNERGSASIVSGE